MLYYISFLCCPRAPPPYLGPLVYLANVATLRGYGLTIGCRRGYHFTIARWSRHLRHSVCEPAGGLKGQDARGATAEEITEPWNVTKPATAAQPTDTRYCVDPPTQAELNQSNSGTAVGGAPRALVLERNIALVSVSAGVTLGRRAISSAWLNIGRSVRCRRRH